MEKKMSFLGQVVSLPTNFWYANILEMMERLAFFGVRAIAPLFMVKSAGENGLGLSYVEKGDIYFWWALIQCLVPMISGGYTDRYGYRKSLAVAFIINAVGYTAMARSKAIADSLAQQGWENPGYWVFLGAACLVALGTAIFKPPVQGTVARSVKEESSSMGWGLFYWTVNIGGALAPMCAAQLRGEIDWHLVFYGAAIVTLANFLPAFLLYKEPERSPDAGDAKAEKGPVGVFLSSIATIFRDPRLILFLLISSCFWFMLMQLWDLLPNFVDEWVDSSDVAPIFAWFSEGWILESGQTKPEMIININPISIILLVIPISWLIRKINKVAAMVIGMIFAVVGCVGAGATGLGLICCLMIFVFSVGEMTCSPTFNAYIGLIAPKDKKALYMGYANIPFAIGWALGNKVSGRLYENMSSKFNLARRYMVDALGMDSVLVMDKKKLPDEHVMQTMCQAIKSGDGESVQEAILRWWDGMAGRDIPEAELREAVREGFTSILGTVDPDSLHEATQLLWDLHHPYQVWIYLGAVGFVGTVGMILFYFVTGRSRASQDAESGTA